VLTVKLWIVELINISKKYFNTETQKLISSNLNPKIGNYITTKKIYTILMESKKK
jgi:hypothetical protein